MATGQTNPYAIAVDAQNVYWTGCSLTSSSGAPSCSIYEAPIGGGPSTTVAAVAGTDSALAALAVADSTFYVVELDPFGGVVSQGSIWALSAGGAAREVAVDQRSPLNIAVDGSNIYWTDDDPIDGAVMQTRRDGTVKDPPIVVASGRKDPRGLVVDATTITWVDTAEGQGLGSLLQAPIGGGTVTTLASGQKNPRAVTLDGTGLYWTDWGSLEQAGADGTIMSVDLGGGTVTTVAGTGGGAALSMNPVSIAADSTGVYWTNESSASTTSSGSVVAMRRGSSPTVLAQAVNPGPISVDGSRVYYADGNGALVSVPIGGGTVTTLASSVPDPAFLATDATNVYWVTYSVLGVPKAGGPTVTLAAYDRDYSFDSAGGWVSGLAADSTGVYWTYLGTDSDCFADGKVWRFAPGGTAAAIASGQPRPFGIATYGGAVYWANGGLRLEGSVLDTSPMDADTLPGDWGQGSVMKWSP